MIITFGDKADNNSMVLKPSSCNTLKFTKSQLRPCGLNYTICCLFELWNKTSNGCHTVYKVDCLCECPSVHLSARGQ